jgi:hypothetical protein
MSLKTRILKIQVLPAHFNSEKLLNLTNFLMAIDQEGGGDSALCLCLNIYSCSQKQLDPPASRPKSCGDRYTIISRKF